MKSRTLSKTKNKIVRWKGIYSRKHKWTLGLIIWMDKELPRLCVLLGPLACGLVVQLLTVFIQPGNVWHKRVFGVRITHKRANWEQNLFCELESGRGQSEHSMKWHMCCAQNYCTPLRWWALDSIGSSKYQGRFLHFQQCWGEIFSWWKQLEEAWKDNLQETECWDKTSHPNASQQKIFWVHKDKFCYNACILIWIVRWNEWWHWKKACIRIAEQIF